MPMARSLARFGRRWLVALGVCFLAGVAASLPVTVQSADAGSRVAVDVSPSAAHQGGAKRLAPGRVETENVVAELVAETHRVKPGATIDLALVFDIRPHWHTYWKNPGDSGEPPRIVWDLPDGISAGPIQWPYPELIRVGPLANYGYSGRAVHLIPLSIPDDWAVGSPIDLRAQVTWLVCEEHCIPEEGTLSLRLEASGADAGSAATSAGNAAAPEHRRLFADARARLPAPGPVVAALERSDPSAERASMQLRVPTAALGSAPTSATFFADNWGLIEYAAAQPWEVDGEQLAMTLTPGPQPLTTSATGLLVIGTASGTRAVQIDASEPGLAVGGDASTQAGAAAPGSPGEGLVSAQVAPLGLPLALLFALLGGLVLNLMPCVFPILAVKALALAQQGDRPFRQRVLHGAAYTTGVLTLFVVVALLLLALRAAGVALGWGFQLQSPIFVVSMAYLFLLLGLSLAGVVTLGAGLMGVGSAAPAHGHLGAFATGALAALVAAPCTAPFMGAALGYAFIQPWPVALAVILALGVGMALPFLALTLSPALARRLPRPGRWMETLKQFLAFPMFATAAWLLWVLGQQVAAPGMGAALGGSVLLAFGLWSLEASRNVQGPWGRIGKVAAAASLAAVLWLVVAMVPNDPARQAQLAAAAGDSELASAAFASDRLAEARSAGRPVFVNMTAAWCITCLVNERVALHRPAVVEAFAEQNVLYLKGDWTNRDASITDYLAGYGRNGVPLYVYYAPREEPKVLPQVLTESIVLDALGR